jgi:hypothetical protein
MTTHVDVLHTLYGLVDETDLRRLARHSADFPHQHLPGRGASLAEIASVFVDQASPEMWARFVEALAAERPSPKSAADIARLRAFTPTLAANPEAAQAKQAAREEHIKACIKAARSVLRDLADKPRDAQLVALGAADAYLIEALYGNQTRPETP